MTLTNPSDPTELREDLARLDGLPRDELVDELLSCCGARRWAKKMADARPFANLETLLETADRVWLDLGESDWLEAFSCHPRIGERKPSGGGGATHRESRWSGQEQAGTRSGSGGTMDALAQANRDYEARFGHVYLVCATGKTADEMLALALNRLQNEPQDELREAAEQQRQITRIRLLKLLEHT